MALESSVEEVKNAALSLLQEAEQRIRALESQVVKKKNQLEEAREQLFRMRQFEIEAGQWKSRASSLEKLVEELSGEREALLERVKCIDCLQKSHKSAFNTILDRKLRRMEPVSVQVLPSAYETKEIHVGLAEGTPTARFRICHYFGISMPNNEGASRRGSIESVSRVKIPAEYQQMEQEKQSCSSITSLSGSISRLGSADGKSSLRNSEESIRLTSVSQIPHSKPLTINNNRHSDCPAAEISSFYALHSTIMITVGKFVLQQLERHSFCWNGMDQLSIEDLSCLGEIVNNMVCCWDVSNLAKYELYGGKWIPCFRNIWKQVVIHFDDQQSVMVSEHFLYFGLMLFCCFFNWKTELCRKTKNPDCKCSLDENCLDNQNNEKVNLCKRSKIIASTKFPNTRQIQVEDIEHMLDIRQAMEGIVHQLILSNDRIVKRYQYWKKQAQYHKDRASCYQREVSQYKIRETECNLKMLQWKESLLDLKEKLTQLQRVRCDLSKELHRYKISYCNLEELYQISFEIYRYQEKSTKQHRYEIDKLKLDNEKHGKERIRWNEERNEYETKVEQLQLQIQDWKTKVERLRDSLTENESTRKQLEAMLVNIEQRELNAKAEYEKLYKSQELELLEARDCIHELRLQLKQLEYHLAESHKRESILETKVDTLQEALESTKDELVVELVHTKLKLAESYEKMETLQLRKRSIS